MSTTASSWQRAQNPRRGILYHTPKIKAREENPSLYVPNFERTAWIDDGPKGTTAGINDGFKGTTAGICDGFKGTTAGIDNGLKGIGTIPGLLAMPTKIREQSLQLLGTNVKSCGKALGIRERIKR